MLCPPPFPCGLVQCLFRSYVVPYFSLFPFASFYLNTLSARAMRAQGGPGLRLRARWLLRVSVFTRGLAPPPGACYLVLVYKPPGTPPVASGQAHSWCSRWTQACHEMSADACTLTSYF